MIEYDVQCSHSLGNLIDLVNEALANGWLCLGGIDTILTKVYSPGRGEFEWIECYFQAMLKERNDNDASRIEESEREETGEA